jgi:hypothetical protein
VNLKDLPKKESATKKSATKEVVAFCLLLLMGFWPFFYFADRDIGMDWAYFDSLAHILRLNLFSFFQWPLHDPWTCGGVDLLSNPQNFIFSPLVIFTAVFGPKWGNIWSLAVLSIVGGFGYYLFLGRFGFAKIEKYLGGVLFANLSWFGLHFAEGHIVYRTFMLVPLVIFGFLNPLSKRRLYISFLLLTVMILDGGFYSFIFSTLLILAMACLGIVQIKSLWALLAKNRQVFGFWVLSLGFLLVGRMLPILLGPLKKNLQQDHFNIAFESFGRILFDPMVTARENLGSGAIFRMHEYAGYIGVVSAVLIGLGLYRLRINKRHSLLGLLLFFFWAGSGWGGAFNPWSVFQKIPLINIAHVQSRLFFISSLLLIIFVLDGFRQLPKPLKPIIFFFLVMESIWLKSYPIYDFLITQSVPSFDYHLKTESIRQTVNYIPKPSIYFKSHMASATCYEPALAPSSVIPSGSPHYRGEIYAEHDPLARFELLQRTPGRIAFNFELQKKSPILVNTNNLLGWRVVGGDSIEMDLSQKMQEPILLKPRILKGQVQLEYRPDYFIITLLFILVGWSLNMYYIIFRLKGD